MKRKPLIDDALGAPWDAATRACLVSRAARVARARRRLRGVGAGVTVLVVAACWLLALPGKRIAERPELPYATVRTEPAAKSVIVRTRPFTAFVPSAREGSFAMVRTDLSRPGYQALSDDELLALFAGRAVMLVRDGGRARLFLDGRVVGSGAAPGGGSL